MRIKWTAFANDYPGANLSSFVQLHQCPPVDASIRPPGSKSITNRAIVCAALASGTSHLSGVLDSEDTQVMMGAWRQVGLRLSHDPADHTLTIDGCAGTVPTERADIFVGNSGTTVRFLTAALSACTGRFRLDGVRRMRERPIGDLIRALEALGGKIERLNETNPDCPPVAVHASGLQGGAASVPGNISSQFLSGLMMAAPLASDDVNLNLQGELVSVPYVEMTARVMRAFGAEVHGQPGQSLTISSTHPYRGRVYSIEPDASAASYFWAAAAITGGRARVEGLGAASLQGDVQFCELLKRMGCEVEYGDGFTEIKGGSLTGIDAEMTDISDTVQTLAAVALFAAGSTTVRGVAHNRYKETDRIADLATELRKFGAEIDEHEDGLTIRPPRTVGPAVVETYQDHRMAMSMGLVGLRVGGTRILDPQCTAKTYPGFWDDLEAFSGCRIDRSD